MTESIQPKRKPGRPKGSSCKNAADAVSLGEIAGLVVDQAIAPTTAMRRLGIRGSSETRRLQRKWREREAFLVKAARERRDNTPALMEAFYRAAAIGYVLNRGVSDYLRSPEAEMMAMRLRDFTRGPLAQGIQALAESPTIQYMRAMAVKEDRQRAAIQANEAQQELRKSLVNPRL